MVEKSVQDSDPDPCWAQILFLNRQMRAGVFVQVWSDLPPSPTPVSMLNVRHQFCYGSNLYLSVYWAFSEQVSLDVLHHEFHEDDAYNQDCAAFKVGWEIYTFVSFSVFIVLSFKLGTLLDVQKKSWVVVFT